MQIKTTEGIVEGEKVDSEYGRTYYSFKSIPYAAPPVGDLRFKAPQPPQPWEGVRSAKSHGSKCNQFNFLIRQSEPGSEDCLYLNVYTPDVKPAKPLPVIFFIHGGGYVSGSGNDDVYGPDFLIRHNVILVTINYRLEILGFLCLETEDIPGNAGMKDQVAAMRWVQKNIANFGGDPDNVTLMGQSAGACSVTYHCVSPMTKGLFKRGIAQSGCLLGWWTQTYRPKEKAKALARHLGCTSEDDKEIYEFFKTEPVENLLGKIVPLTYADQYKDKYEVQFAVVSEKEYPNEEPYFTGDILNALKNNVHEGVELILGYTQDDGSFNFSLSHDIKETIYQANNIWVYFVPKELYLYCSPNDHIDIGAAIKKFYFDNEEISTRNLTKLSKYFGAEMFKFALLQAAKYFSRRNKIYFYKFTRVSERNIFSKICGVSQYFDGQCVGHIDDIPYLFPVKGVSQTIEMSSATFNMIDKITKLWTNFAKSGNPTPDTSLGINWRPFRADMQSYLEIGDTLKRCTKPDKEEMTFWEDLFNKYLPKFVYKPE